tara:strand:- start:6567 stop:7118 length:552 start_codon:yes stop_codon:yes gene_type:complete
MDFENMNIWCWLIPAIVGIVSGILGYLIGKGGNTTIDNSADLKLLRDKNARLQADLDTCNNRLTAKAAAVATPLTASPVAAAAFAFDAATAKAAIGKAVKKDDLKVVEGIGPKIAELFHKGGITTWHSLSDAPVARCQEILDAAGDRYRIHDPASWPMQAKMAYEGKWTELAKWQDEHKHGKL